MQHCRSRQFIAMQIYEKALIGQGNKTKYMRTFKDHTEYLEANANKNNEMPILAITRKILRALEQLVYYIMIMGGLSVFCFEFQEINIEVVAILLGGIGLIVLGSNLLGKRGYIKQ